MSSKRPAAEFERALEGVFEHRARDFSNELRQLLEELWLEGVRQGRALERLETHDLERALELGVRDRARDLASGSSVITSSAAGRTLEPGELTLEMITQAVRDLEAQFPRGVRQLEPSFGLRALERLAVPLEPEFLEVRAPTFELRELRAPASGTWRREMFGEWAGSSDECPSNSQKPSSESSPRSSTPGSSASSGTGRSTRGTSGRT